MIILYPVSCNLVILYLVSLPRNGEGGKNPTYVYRIDFVVSPDRPLGREGLETKQGKESDETEGDGAICGYDDTKSIMIIYVCMCPKAQKIFR